MISILYNIVYLLALLLFSPLLLISAIRKGKYREGFAEKFLGHAPKLEKCATKRVWVHAVSVGEVNLAATIWKRYSKLHPDWEFVFSTTSRAGHDLARKKFPENTVFYAPLDFSWSVAAALERIRPDFLILVELELWPNLLIRAKKRNVPVFVVNGRLGEKSFRNYRRVKCLLAPAFRTITRIVAQDDASRERFVSLGVEESRVRQTGSIKYDGANSDRNNARTRALAELWNIRPTDTVFLAGSTQNPEEAMAVAALRELSPSFPNLRLILVPRHPERFEEVARMLENAEFSWIRRSELQEGTHDEKILLVDTVGELGAWWGTAQIGFVGGSMGRRGGQNMIEPAAYGVAVSFGPNTWNFRDIVSAFLANRAAVVVRNQAEMTAFVASCLRDSGFLEQLSVRASQFVASQQGALDETLRLIDEQIL